MRLLQDVHKLVSVVVSEQLIKQLKAHHGEEEDHERKGMKMMIKKILIVLIQREKKQKDVEEKGILL